MRKKKLIFTLLIIVFTITSVSAQEKINTLSVDAGTYAYYEQGEWKKLIEAGKKSLEKGIDFYYLRYRMGVAYYQLKKYRKAVEFFEKVLKETPKDVLAREYLYYSYLFSGMYEDARVYGNTLPPDMQKKLNIYHERLIVNGIGAEYKYYIIDDYKADIEDGDILNQKILNNLWYSDLNLTGFIKNNYTLFQGFSYLSGRYRVSNNELYDTLFDENIRQFQYYISVNRHISKGTGFKAAFHYINTKLEAPNPDAIQNPGQGHGGNQSKYLYSDKLNGFAGFVKFGKSISNFDFTVTATVSYFDTIVGTQYIPSIGAIWYPLGNTELYIGGEVKYIIAGDIQDYNPGFIYKSKIGARLFKSLWIEPFMLYGEAMDFVDDDAFIVYNSHNKINYWYGINLNTSLSKNRLYLYFSWQKYSMTNIYYLNFNKNSTDFNISTFLGGIKLSF